MSCSKADKNPLYVLSALSIDHLAGREPDDLNDLPHVSRVGFVLRQILHNMPKIRIYNIDDLDRDLSD